MANSPLGIGLGLAATGVATAAGIATGRLLKARERAIELGTESAYDDIPSRESVVISDGTPLHVEIDEPDGGAERELTVVLVHGFTLNLKTWHYQRRALVEAGYRVVMFDHRGHGQSEEAEPETYLLEQLADDLARVLDQEVPEGPLLLVGHSMGGMAILTFAERFPDVLHSRVLGVGLLCTTAGSLQESEFGLLPQMRPAVHKIIPAAMRGLSARQTAVDGVRKAGRDAELYFVHRYSYGSDVPMALVEHTADMIFATPIATMSAYLTSLMGHDRWHCLPALDGIETLVMHGNRDRLVPIRLADRMVEALPNAEYVVVDKAGHMLPMECPDVVDEQVVALAERASRAIEKSPQKRRADARERTGGKPRRTVRSSSAYQPKRAAASRAKKPVRVKKAQQAVSKSSSKSARGAQSTRPTSKKAVG